MQLLAEEGRAGPVDLDLGDVVGAVGKPARTRRGEPSLAVDELQLLRQDQGARCPDTFHGVTDVEQRYRRRYLDLLMNEETRADFVIRTRMVTAIRRYLDAQGFIEVETPVLQPRYGGAFAEPFVTHSNELDSDLYLRIATELYLKRLIVGGLERVYEIGKDFRNESVSYKHQPEFTMLEWYEAYADYRDTMARIEELVATVAQEAIGTTEVTFRGHEVDLARRGSGVKLVDALEEHGLWTRDEAELRARLDEREVDTKQDRTWAQLVDHALQQLRRAEPDRADDPARLPGRALAVRARDRRRPDDRRALRVLRRRHGARQRLQRDQRLGRAGGALRACRRRTRPRATRRRSRATPTTSRRSATACRRPAGSGSASTGSRWCSPAGTRSAT